MRLRQQLGFVLLLVPLAGATAIAAAPAPAPRRADAKELDRLRGEWTLVRETSSNGTVHMYGPKDSSIGHWTLTFDGRKFVTDEDYTDPSYIIEGSVALNVARIPKGIDFTVTEVNSSVDEKLKRQTRVGIYELDGDRLKLCLTEYGVAKRPAAFKAGKGRGVYEFKRVRR